MDDLVLVIVGFKPSREYMLGETGLLLIKVYGDDREIKGHLALNLPEQVQHRIAVFAPRQASHNSVTWLDQSVVKRCLGHHLEQSPL